MPSAATAPSPNKSIKAWLIRLAIVACVLVPAQIGEFWLAGIAGVIAIPIVIFPFGHSTWNLAAFVLVLAVGAGVVLAGFTVGG